MWDLTTTFIISQVAMFVAMGFDFLSLQYKHRRAIFGCLIVSASLISAHYFLLWEITAGIIVSISVLRFITCLFTTDRKYLYLFLVLNTIVLITTYSSWHDLLIYTGLFIFIIGNFQSNDKLMRLQMMAGTSMIIIYNLIIWSPMWVFAESAFLVSGMIGYWRYYISKSSKNNTIDSMEDYP